MKFHLRRAQLPHTALTILPFLLFFPIGVVYLGVVFFLVGLLIAGDYRARWRTVRDNPLFWPVLVLLAASWLAAVFLVRPAEGFWSAFGHYQTYLFLLLFVSIGKGDWQKRALTVFFAGAIYAASLYYLSFLQVLPAVQPFTNYVVYSGNKSILLGILLALAAGWMLYELTVLTDRRTFWWRLIAFLYVAAALLCLATTRTGVLIFLLLCILATLKYFSLSWRGLRWLAGVVVMASIVWGLASDFRMRAMGTVNDIHAFTQGQKISAEGNRLDIYAVTSQIIAEKPLAGHGIGTWTPMYGKLALESGLDLFSTPHNEYLLHAAEMGAVGLAALLWVWLAQLAAAWKMGGDNGMRLLMLGMAIMVGGMFNAILRDAVFGMAIMVLLAIPLAGATRGQRRPAGHAHDRETASRAVNVD